MGATINEDGLSLHIFSTDDGSEYLRFDCFDDAPHYHYINAAESTNVVHDFDAVAHGSAVPWALRTIATRMKEMLCEARAPQLAAVVDSSAIATAMPAILAEVERMLHAGRPTSARPPQVLAPYVQSPPVL